MGTFDKFADDPNADRIPPGQTLVKGFPVLTYGHTPQLAREEWTCRVFGVIDCEHVFTWDDLLAMHQTKVTCDIHCVTRWTKLDMEWEGVRFTDFLQEIERKCGCIPGEANFVLQHAEGGYTTNTPISHLLDDNVLLAHTYDGKPLEPDHGGPVRMLVPRYYFWKSAKWLNGFEFLSRDRPGFWERYGYHNNGDPWQEERFSH
ncbi:MAG: sulfite oxidase-like oxidoreductase [Candidatus Sumerlaeia bacterium]|nr:sulfite oxidase-like oxidoreductase [Candidatus Sumerlaeia bacterium]